MNYIYGLYCPINGELRYIGKAKNTEERFHSHLRSAKKESKSYVARWIRTLIRDGLIPELRILRELNADQDWRIVERECIEKARIEGARLTNILAGGQGAMYLDTSSPEYMRRNVAVAAGVKASWEKPERRALHIAAWQSPELKARHSAKMTDVQAKPEIKAKLSIANKRRWVRLKADPEAFEAWRTSCSKAATLRWQRTHESLKDDVEALKRFHEAHSLAGKKSLETARVRGTDSTSPAVRARISAAVSAAMKKSWQRRKEATCKK